VFVTLRDFFIFLVKNVVLTSAADAGMYTINPSTAFYIFLTVHLRIILVGEQRRTISSIICLIESSTCFEQLCANPQEDNCINTTSGIITVC
jgi:hypothetical protein